MERGKDFSPEIFSSDDLMISEKILQSVDVFI